jgi:cytochrome c-type protein NapC
VANDQPSALKRLWRFLRRPHAKYSLLALLFVGFIGGILFWGGFHTALEMTNNLAFCTSCHEMRDTVFQEYKQTIHYSNRTGVRATCPDCHVPREWGPKLARKAAATFELWGKITGAVDTPEKFEAARMKLATNEWAKMKATDSRECRNCHSFEGMSGEIQKQTVYKKHMGAKAQGQTCIDCHKGIAHHLPKEYRNPEEEE